MKRIGSAIALLAAVTVAAVLAVNSGPGSSYRIAALFDTANGLVSGQQVKVAGAVVGAVRAVSLAPGPKARIVMSVEKRFATFHADATCTILPEGLISEKFVQCDPGRAPAALAPGADGLPTVPLASTTVPFSLQDVLNVLSLPTDQRLGLLISQLGIGTAGRGQDVNALLLRANPALTESRHVLRIVNAQRAQLASAIGQTEQVLSLLAHRADHVREFVDRASVVAQTTARHSTPLGEAVARLPAMLAAVRPGLRSLNRATANTTPLLSELQTAAPGLNELTHQLPPFARAGIPALRTLAAAAASGQPAVRDALPVINHLQAVANPLNKLGTGLAQLLVSSQGQGALDGALWAIYVLANHASLYDGTSHFLSVIANVAPGCILGQQAGIDVPGCSHKYSAPGQGSIPVNEPSCGPKSAAWFAQRCPLAPPGPSTLATPAAGGGSAVKLTALQKLLNRAPSGTGVKVQQLQPLLNFLLK
jgi:virulence factor Mce-like protein